MTTSEITLFGLYLLQSFRHLIHITNENFILMTALPETRGSVSLANWNFAATWVLGSSLPQRIILVLWSMFFVVVLLSLSLNVF
jgi:hypothetical protein